MRTGGFHVLSDAEVQADGSVITVWAQMNGAHPVVKTRVFAPSLSPRGSVSETKYSLALVYRPFNATPEDGYPIFDLKKLKKYGFPAPEAIAAMWPTDSSGQAKDTPLFGFQYKTQTDEGSYTVGLPVSWSFDKIFVGQSTVFWSKYEEELDQFGMPIPHGDPPDVLAVGGRVYEQDMDRTYLFALMVEERQTCTVYYIKPGAFVKPVGTFDFPEETSYEAWFSSDLTTLYIGKAMSQPQFFDWDLGRAGDSNLRYSCEGLDGYTIEVDVSAWKEAAANEMPLTLVPQLSVEGTRTASINYSAPENYDIPLEDQPPFSFSTTLKMWKGRDELDNPIYEDETYTESGERSFFVSPYTREITFLGETLVDYYWDNYVSQDVANQYMMHLHDTGRTLRFGLEKINPRQCVDGVFPEVFSTIVNTTILDDQQELYQGIYQATHTNHQPVNSQCPDWRLVFVPFHPLQGNLGAGVVYENEQAVTQPNGEMLVWYAETFYADSESKWRFEGFAPGGGFSGEAPIENIGGGDQLGRLVPTFIGTPFKKTLTMSSVLS
jgi:hypothetical protein